MKKNKPFGELFYRSLKKTLLIMRIAVILMILGILQVRANDAYSQKTRLSLNFSDTDLSRYLIKLKMKVNFSSCTMKNFLIPNVKSVFLKMTN